MAQLGNLCPESVEEAKQLIASLSVNNEDGELQRVIDGLSTIRRYQS